MDQKKKLPSSHKTFSQQFLRDFAENILSVHVQYFDTEEDDELTSEIQFSLGLDRPSVYVEVPHEVAQSFIEASPEDRNDVFEYVLRRFS